MALKIQTTGLEQYAPGGNARVKALIIGGPGVGKTRWSSYFPRPLYANCEGGLASVADRRVQFVDIHNSKEMLSLLENLDAECKLPADKRHFDTFIVDTLDAFSRKVQDEWLLKNPNETTFRGFDAWAYLDAKLQMLLTRLLNLDMNVIVLCHYQDKMITEGSGAEQVQRREYQLQLSGKVKDQVFNDFDLVGWMDTSYGAEQGVRVQKRHLTFKPSPDKAFLKDRLNATDAKIEVTFSDEDYTNLFSSIISRLDEFGATEDFGEIEVFDEDALRPAPVAPPAGGAVAEASPQEIPLVQHDKPTLMRIARDLGLKPAGNILKGELVAAIEEAKAAPAIQPEVGTDVTDITPVADVSEGARVAAEALARAREAATSPVSTADLKEEPEGVVNTATGELVEPAAEQPEVAPTMDEAVSNVQAAIGAEVLDVTTSEPEPEPAAASSVKKDLCEVCGKDLLEEPSRDHVKIAYIKTRKKLCNADWAVEKAARESK